MKYLVEFNLTQVNFNNLTNSTLVFDNTQNGTTPQGAKLYKLKYMAVESAKDGIFAKLIIQFINKTSGEPFNLQATEYTVCEKLPRTSS